MKMAINKILSMILIFNSITILPANNETLLDLEFYVNTDNCIPKYFACKNSLATNNPDIDCLQWGQCLHLRTLEALLGTPYVQSILSGNQQLTNNINNLLSEYGRNNLAKIIANYSIANVTELLTELVTNLNGQDLTALSNSGQLPSSP